MPKHGVSVHNLALTFKHAVEFSSFVCFPRFWPWPSPWGNLFKFTRSILPCQVRISLAFSVRLSATRITLPVRFSLSTRRFEPVCLPFILPGRLAQPYTIWPKCQPTFRGSSRPSGRTQPPVRWAPSWTHIIPVSFVPGREFLNLGPEGASSRLREHYGALQDSSNRPDVVCVTIAAVPQPPPFSCHGEGSTTDRPADPRQ